MTEEIIRQVAGSMALSGMDLTEEDKVRIRAIESQEEADAEVQRLVSKYRGTR